MGTCGAARATLAAPVMAINASVKFGQHPEIVRVHSYGLWKRSEIDFGVEASRLSAVKSWTVEKIIISGRPL
jgi:hypothetical protein